MNSKIIADSRKTRAVKEVKRNRRTGLVLSVVFAIIYAYAFWAWVNYGG